MEAAGSETKAPEGANSGSQKTSNIAPPSTLISSLHISDLTGQKTLEKDSGQGSQEPSSRGVDSPESDDRGVVVSSLDGWETEGE
jgi:hypothetical protein